MSRSSGHDPSAAVSPGGEPAPPTAFYGHDDPRFAEAGVNQQTPPVPTGGGPVSPPPAGYMPGPQGIAPGQARGEWWQVPMVGNSQMPAASVAGFVTHGAVAGHTRPGHLGARPLPRRSSRPRLLVQRATTVLAVLLAALALIALVAGFGGLDILGSDYPDSTRQILVDTVAYMVAAMLWVVAGLLLWKRYRAGRVMAGLLATAYFALNASTLYSDYSLMATVYIHNLGWGSGFIFGDSPGERIIVAAALLSALMLVLVLISLLIARGQNHRPGPPPANNGRPGPAGYLGGRPGPATPPHHPDR